MRLRRVLNYALRDEKGSFSIEAVLMFPLLVWAFVAMYVFFEGLRESNINLKATYTISDLLSRETGLIDETYLEGINDVYGWLSRSANPVSMRVTVVRYDEASNRHIRIWSRGIAGREDLTQAEVEEKLTPHVPIMADADTAIVVETWTTYDPLMDIGLVQTEIHNLVVTNPRFSEQLMLEGLGDGGGSIHNDGTDDTEGL
ncbi:TadE/TadG family type IV pilus assembly protein [Silicimonas sp. MF1-12-2]|uniref:TadE/TadG family type IV pilus assembly protein n=1 Tax=Silicimonas sp. MF1-12-2 TaxID=3384793 RepID=UPI0039B47F5E